MKYTQIFLSIIILLFLSTRLFKIDEIPKSLYWDEASIGYNAYSVLKTGHDEWGDFLPIHFRSFGEFKLPVYVYSVVVSEFFLSPSIVAVRLPAVIFSLFSIILTFFISRKIYNSLTIAIFSAFILTISPWFFIFSRVGYEATAGLTFYLLGVYLAFLSFKKNYLFLLLIISFILAIYSYNSYRITVPISLLIYLIFFLKKKFSKNNFFIVIVCITIFLLSLLPIYKLYKFDYGATRFNSVSIFLDNKDTASVSQSFIENYFSHFSPNFLLIGDTNLRNQQEGFGQIYLLDLFFISLGLIYLIRQHKLIYFLPIFIILLSIVPAAITKESPHALRSLGLIPFLAMLISVGVYQLIKISKYKKWMIIVIIIAYILFFSNYFYNFLIKYPSQSLIPFQYPYQYLFKKYTKDFNNFDKIYVTDYYGQPYIFDLFYNKLINPNLELNDIDKWGQSKVTSIGSVNFGKINSNILNNQKSLIIFSSPGEKLDIPPRDILKNSSGEELLYIYEKK